MQVINCSHAFVVVYAHHECVHLPTIYNTMPQNSKHNNTTYVFAANKTRVVTCTHDGLTHYGLN
jgi:hypothetical protein